MSDDRRIQGRASARSAACQHTIETGGLYQWEAGSYFTAQHAALICRISGPDFFQPVHKYRMHQRVAGFTFIQPREVPPAAVRVVLPEITDF